MSAQSKNELNGGGPKVDHLPGYKRSDPSYFRDPAIDHLVEVCLLLGAEVWTNRSRQLIMEQLLERDGVVTEEAIEKFVPDEGLKAKWREQRKAFVRRVYKPLYGEKFEEEKGSFFEWLTE